MRDSQHLFKNIATLPGRSHLKDAEGLTPYVNVLDIEDKNVYDILAALEIDGHYFLDDMCKKTFVAKTRKKWGRHICWLSHKQNVSIGTSRCKIGSKFEIKTDNSLGHCTLPPSRHRDDENFHYQSIGQQKLAILDNLYDGLRRELSECLKYEKPQQQHHQNTSHSPSSGSGSGSNPDSELQLFDNDIDEILYSLESCYKKGSRQKLVLGLSGLLYKGGVNLESAEKLVTALSRGDEEKDSRMAALRATYKKGEKGKENEIAGTSILLEVLTSLKDEKVAKDILSSITRVINHRKPALSQLSDHVRQELPAWLAYFFIIRNTYYKMLCQKGP